jgi:hypothetical protein
VVVVFFFVLVASLGGSRQGAYACIVREKKKRKKLELVLSKRRILQKFGTWVCGRNINFEADCLKRERD